MWSTKYNLTLDVAADATLPRARFLRTVEQFVSEGLTGEKHVNRFGRVFEGHDDSCKVHKRGAFEISSRDYSRLTSREMLERISLATSGDDLQGMDLLERMEYHHGFLEEHDPIIGALPLEDYFQIPMVGSQEILTMCGRQPLHIHPETGGLIRFMRPKDGSLWDFDSLKDYLSESAGRLIHLELDLQSRAYSSIAQKMLWKMNIRRLRPLRKLYDQLTSDPDSLVEIPL